MPPLDYRYNSYAVLIKKPRPLVRFRGMVQSTGHEVYRSLIPPAKLGGWGLSEEEEGDGLIDSNSRYTGPPVLDDRNTIWAVSVPGETEWMALVCHRVPSVSKTSQCLFLGTRWAYSKCVSNPNRLFCRRLWLFTAQESRYSALQSHKYPLPGEPHLGVNVKVNRALKLKCSESDIRRLRSYTATQRIIS
jgi:hypothetical protein